MFAYLLLHIFCSFRCLKYPQGVIKINTNASLQEEGWVGAEVATRDSKGTIMFTTSRRTRAWWPPEIVEAKAVAYGRRLGKRYGLTDIIVESDSQILISRLTKGVMYYSDLDSILEDILAFSVSFNSVIWSHVRRDGNLVAHHLARLLPFGIASSMGES